MGKAIVLLYGSDTYQIKQKTDKIIKEKNIDEYNVAYYDAEEVDIENALQDASTIPFMAESKVVVVKNVLFLTKDEKTNISHNLDAFSRYIQNPTTEATLVLQVPSIKLDKRKAIVKLLIDNAEMIMCEPLKEIDLRSWVKRQLGLEGISIDRDALDEFILRTQNNTEVVVNETKKLLLFAMGETKINIDTIKKVVTRNVEDNVYEIINYILGNNKKEAIRVYEDLIYHSEDPLKILRILVNKYQEILHAKILLKKGANKHEIADYFNASTGRAYYIIKNASASRLDDVFQQLKQLEELDYKIKSGKIDKKFGLELFILHS